MRLLIIRHGDPDYSVDSLTDKGWREADLVADRLSREKIAAVYSSPKGRALHTAEVTASRTGHTITICPWLQEFWAPIWRPDVAAHRMITWDWLPQDWTADERYFQADHWFETPIMVEGGVKAEYDRVTGKLDALLALHGYLRDGKMYRTEQGNHDTLALFCHFGVESVLLSHLLGVSPMVLWHGTCAAPTSVTTVFTEERRKGRVFFRIQTYGDVSHLTAAGEPVSFAARFCECWEDEQDRHD